MATSCQLLRHALLRSPALSLYLGFFRSQQRPARGVAVERHASSHIPNAVQVWYQSQVIITLHRNRFQALRKRSKLGDVRCEVSRRCMTRYLMVRRSFRMSYRIRINKISRFELMR